MQDIYDIVKNVEGIYESDTGFQILKDFERVLDELDIYVYDNWEDGELAEAINAFTGNLQQNLALPTVNLE